MAIRFELNKAGVRELMQSDEMMAVCKKYADNAQSRLGKGYSVNTMVGQNRVNAEVLAETYQAKKENSENNSILKAVFSS